MRTRPAPLSHLAPLICLLAGLGFSASVLAQKPPKPLNDTGQITCYNNSAATGTVGVNPAPEAAGFEEQDCTQGRSAQDALGTLPKHGSSSVKGHDYSKICMSGEAAGEGTCPANPALGSGANDWACTRDNVTGLVWEVKVDDAGHMRHYKHRYTWYDTNGAINGGNAGTAGNTSTCGNTLGGQTCNTTNFRNAVNALTGANRLCGKTDWRLPTANELHSLVDYQRASGPMIDAGFFPNTANAVYWSGENYASSASFAWYVNFGIGLLSTNVKSLNNHVRLVRGGQ